MITDPAVIRESIARGVERGIFAYALGDAEARKFDTIRFKVSLSADQFELSESAWLLRPALADELLPKPKAAEPGPMEGATPASGPAAATTGGVEEPPKPGKPKIVQGERRLDWVRIQMRVPWEKWPDIYNEVIEPLAKEGADILVDVNIVAQSEGAIRENLVELGIKESLSQHGINAKVETR
jgi:hypothetical protein